MTPADKLYLVGRRDLPLGLAAAQLVHAAIDWALDRREEALAFREASNTVVLVTVEGQTALLAQNEDASDTMSTLFRDIDVGENEATALALSPGPMAKKLCRGLPLFGG